MCIHAGVLTHANMEGKEMAVNNEGSVFNHPYFVCLAVVRISLVNLQNSIAKLLL